MLTVSDDAATLIHSLISQAERVGRTGLRIVIDSDHDSLSMSLADVPLQADDIVVAGEARVFPSPSASRRLDQRTLRAAVSEHRSSGVLGGPGMRDPH